MHADREHASPRRPRREPGGCNTKRSEGPVQTAPASCHAALSIAQPESDVVDQGADNAGAEAGAEGAEQQHAFRALEMLAVQQVGYHADFSTHSHSLEC